MGSATEESASREKADVSVSGHPEYSLEEILAHAAEQQALRDQRATRYVADMTTEMRYRLGASGQDLRVRIEGRYFHDAKGQKEIENLRMFVNGAPFSAGKDRLPELPLLQPEKVNALPLEVRLDKSYDYQLLGQEVRDGRESWKIGLKPASATGTAYQGVTWIDAATWDRLGMDVTQTGVEPPVLGSAEQETFGPVQGPQGEAWLVQRSHVQRTLSVLGTAVAVDMRVTWSGWQVEPPDFDAQRDAARASQHQMLRDTDEGLRYMRAGKDGSREIAPERSRKLFVLGGARYDASYASKVIPLAGFNLLDYDAFHRGLQLNAFIAGAFNTLEIADPKLLGSHWTGAFEVQLPAIKSRDDLRLPGVGDVDAESASVLEPRIKLVIGHALGPFAQVGFVADAGYQKWSRTKDTAPGFDPPRSNVATRVGGSLELHRRSLDGQAWFRRLERSGWGKWGPEDAAGKPTIASASGAWTWGGTVGGTWYPGKLQRAGIAAEWRDSSGTDRWDQYEFTALGGAQLPGFDGSHVHFDRAGIVRATYGFSVAGHFGVDLTAGWARTWDHLLPSNIAAAFGDSSDHVGVGLAGNLPGPKRTIVRFEVSTALRSSDFSDVEGDVVAQVLFLKLLR